MKNKQLFTDRQKLVLSALQHLDAGRVTVGDVAQRIGRSPRQVIRLHQAFKERGADAVVHGNANRRPANAIDEETAERAVHLATTKYEGFNFSYTAYLLKHYEDLDLSESTLRRYLLQKGVKPPTEREAPQHRSRRPRREQAGQLLQMDGSPHRWFGPDGPEFNLIDAVDDATNDAQALFREAEDTEGLFSVLRMVVERRGLPHAVYTDRFSVFTVNKTYQTSADPFFDDPRNTQFGRLCAELGIRLILAKSPEAKGRIERFQLTAQGRIPSIARLLGAKTMDDAPDVLAMFMRDYRAQFVVPARDPNPAWLPIPEDLVLDDVFCLKFVRVLGRDYTISFNSTTYQLPKSPDPYIRPGSRLEVWQLFDGTVKLASGQSVLAVYPAPTPPRLPWRPAVNHPWRQYPKADR